MKCSIETIRKAYRLLQWCYTVLEDCGATMEELDQCSNCSAWLYDYAKTERNIDLEN